MAKFELDTSFLNKYVEIFEYLKNLEISDIFKGKWILSHSARGRTPLILLRRPEYSAVRTLTDISNLTGINLDSKRLMAITFQPGGKPDKTLLVRKHRQWAEIYQLDAWRRRKDALKDPEGPAWLTMSELFDRKTYTYSKKVTLASTVQQVLDTLLADML